MIDEKQFWAEARSWEQDRAIQARRSARIAWVVAGVATLAALAAAGAVASLAPLKTVEPFVIRVDGSSGVVDVISVLAGTEGVIEDSAREALDKYFLARYLRHREEYHHETRAHDWQAVGLMSTRTVANDFVAERNPELNPAAPVTLHRTTQKSEITIKTITWLDRNRMVGEERQPTALIRFSKQIIDLQTGQAVATSHWTATATYTYRSGAMQIQDRLENPLGFQVLAWRKDEEAA